VDRPRAGELLGSGLAWRIAAGAIAFVVMPLVCLALGYDPGFIHVLLLALLVSLLITVASACQDVFRGFERTDFAAATYVAWQLLSAAVAVPVLLKAGTVTAFLIAQAACAAVGAAFVLRMLPRMNVHRLAVRWATVKELFLTGRGFFAFAAVLALQPLVDAAMLSRFGSAESMGWFAASRKLIGILIYPASALVVTLYPTLCRLYGSDANAFRRTAADAFQVTALIVMPLALGCALFPEIGVMIFSEQRYGPAEDNLRILSIYVLLVYFSMPIGTCLTATGRQSAWALVQFLCILVSVVCDPPLIAWFQAHTGNGGLGVCVAIVISEVLMVGIGLYLLPSGILDRQLLRRLGCASLAGIAMAVAAVGLDALHVPVFVRAVLAVATYAGVLVGLGAADIRELRAMVGALRVRQG
jgi:O-antigen/teichoic acid export membrane protein